MCMYVHVCVSAHTYVDVCIHTHNTNTATDRHASLRARRGPGGGYNTIQYTTLHYTTLQHYTTTQSNAR